MMQRARGGRRRPMSEINVVPYIDVMLVLLVIFMATAPLLLQGVEVELPAANDAPLPDTNLPDPLVVTVRADGSIWVNVGLSSEEEADRVSLGNLAAQVDKILATRPELPIYVRADTSLAYGRVIEVMSVLQDGGARSVGLVTEPVQLDGDAS